MYTNYLNALVNEERAGISLVFFLILAFMMRLKKRK